MLLLFVFLLYPALALSTDLYTWYLFPSASDRLYGYQSPVANNSFESEPLPSGSYVTKEEGVNGVWVPAGEKVTLGDFLAGCLADAGGCNNFTVSFLFKINGSIPENGTVHIIHQMPITDAEYLLQFSVSQNNSHYTAVAIVARGVNKTEVSGVISFTESWIHAAIIYKGPGYLELFLNGTSNGLNTSTVHYNGSVTQVDMTLGSSNNSNGLFLSYLNILEEAIQTIDVDLLMDDSFAQATNPNRTTVTVSQSSRVFDESDGTVTIFVEREGNLRMVSVVMYTLSEDIATNSLDFTFEDPSTGQLIFKPGEITKSLLVNIINDTSPEMNETFLLNLTSQDGFTNVTNEPVRIFIVDNDIDECASDPCQNNGTCTDLLLDYNCTCMPGYTGENCTIVTCLWYMFPESGNRIYGYEPMSNLSFESDELSPGTKVAIKDYTHSILIPQTKELSLGSFANPCFENATVCSSFSISFLIYIKGSVSVNEDVYVLDSNSTSRGSYHVQFLVTKTSARLEGHAFVVGGNSSQLLERKILFPATDAWVHVVIVYSVSGSLELYVNSVMVTAGDALVPTAWQSDSSAVRVFLGSKRNSHDIFVSYLQVIKGALSTEEVVQLEKESREQATNPLMAQLELTEDNIAASEGTGSLTVHFLRSGNLAIASSLSYSIKNGTATPGDDFEVPTSDEVVVRPGDTSGVISVVITNDFLHEQNETLSVTVSTSDNVTILLEGDVNITIIDNDIDECASSPCDNSDTCIDLHLDYSCTCQLGYTGKNCSQNIDDCLPGPCEHGSTCNDQINDYSCTCAVGYTGMNCGTDIDDCANNPCQNNGRCNDHINAYNCTCSPGYTGKNCSKDSYLLYMFPTGDNRVYGYDTANNQSFNSKLLPANSTVTHKAGFRGHCMPAASQVILGDFADQCLRSTCDSFTISFLTYVNGALDLHEDVQILYSTPLSEGLYHVQFFVTKTASRLEGQASIVGGNSPSLLERKGTFPGVNRWVHVAIVYSKSSQVLNLYFDSVKVTDPNSTIAWNSNGHGINVSLAFTDNARETCVSYFQIIRDVVTELEIQQLEEECRREAANPSVVEASFVQNNVFVNESVGMLTVPVRRNGNILIASVLQFSSSNIDAVVNVDFYHPFNQEVVVRPGQMYSGIPVNIEDDILHEYNESFQMTLTTSDDVTSITSGFTTITIQDNDIDECAPEPCMNGATCTDLLLDYNCTCVLGFTGRNCDLNMDDCMGDLCQNNGSCVDLVNDYSCTCTPGYAGKNCSDEINECDSSPCLHRSTCQDLLADYNCTCAPGFTGKNCSDDIDECSVFSPCKNGGQCANKMNDYSCKCSEGFEGKDCSTVSASTGEDDKNVLFILFLACIAVLAISLLTFIIAGIYFCRKLKGAAHVKAKRNGYTSYDGVSTL